MVHDGRIKEGETCCVFDQASAAHPPWRACGRPTRGGCPFLKERSLWIMSSPHREALVVGAESRSSCEQVSRGAREHTMSVPAEIRRPFQVNATAGTLRIVM
jgi:hypothetical protein